MSFPEADSVALASHIVWAAPVWTQKSTLMPLTSHSSSSSSSSISREQVRASRSKREEKAVKKEKVLCEAFDRPPAAVSVQSYRPEFIDAQGNNGLLRALLARDAAELKSLLKSHGRMLEEGNSKGRTALLLAARAGDVAAYRILRQAGADDTAVDKHARNVLHHAAFKGRAEMVSYVLRKNRALLETRDNKQHTALLIAASRGHHRACEILIEARADPKLTSGPFEWHALHHAVVGKTIETVRLFVKNKALLETEDVLERRPMHLAAYFDSRDACAILLSEGADTRVQDCSGRTPYKLAEAMGHREILRLFVPERNCVIL